ncbi:MAG: acyl-CoA thioesterase [Microbacterium sp.]|uniref:acyl-CoA thioesterase n=1 Tax=Microbacterium sp. TaxID=51671 RepID=UPI003A89F167
MRLHVPIPLRWGDLDAYNHVNNTAMLKILEEARVRAFWSPGDGEPAPETAVMDSGRRGDGILTLIARQEIEYLAPVPYQRLPLDVQLWFGGLGGSSLEVCYEVCSPLEAAGEQQVYARAATTVVKVDAAAGRPVRLSTQERAVWEPYLEEPVRFTRRP